MQLAFDAVDRLVELLEERRRPVSAAEAAAHVFALRSAPDGLARSLVSDLVEGDGRLAWRGSAIALASVPDDPLLEEAELVVFDLETTGLSARSSRICEIGAVRVRGLEFEDTFQTLVRTGVPLPVPISTLTGHPGRGLAARAGHRRLDPPLSRLRGRRDPGRAQRPLRRRLPRPTARAADRAPPGCACPGHGRAGEAAARRPCPPGQPGVARALLRHVGLALPPRARRCAGHGRGARQADRRGAGARSEDARRPARPRGSAHAAGVREALARARGSRAARRVHVQGQERARPVRRPRPRSPRPAEVVLPLRPAAPVRRGCAGRGRADRVAGAGQRARGGPRGASADPRAAAAGQRPQRAARPLRLPAPPRGAHRRDLDGRRAGSDPTDDGGQSARPARWTGPRSASWRCCSAAGLCRGCAVASASSRLVCATRTRPGSATASPRWRPSSGSSAGSTGCGPSGAASSPRRSTPAGGAPSSSPVDECPRVRSLPPGSGSRIEVEVGVAAARSALAEGPSYAPEHADELLVVHEFLRRPPPELQVLPLDPGVICAQLAA